MKKICIIHDNGGRPFKVLIEDGVVSIYKSTAKDIEESEESQSSGHKQNYSKLIASYIPKDIYIGKSSGAYKFCDHSKKDAPLFDGNTLLLHLGEKNCIFIGEKIYQFKMEDDIEAYYSPVGNNDVPYPLVVGKEWVYFMLDKKRVPRSQFPKGQEWEDAYSLFYGKFTPKDGWVSPLDPYKKGFRSKLIHKRLGW